MILSAEAALAFSTRDANFQIVLVTGCFDVIHVGHVNLLRHAATFGPVVVGVNCDEAVRTLKGPTRPVNTLNDRMAVLGAMNDVMWVMPVWDLRVNKTILAIRPNYWVKGGDYAIDTLDKDEVAAARAVGAEIIIFPSTGHSTTKILSKA